MLRLRQEVRLPAEIPLDTSVPVQFFACTERARWCPRDKKSKLVLRTSVLDAHSLQPMQGLSFATDPPRPAIDPLTGHVSFRGCFKGQLPSRRVCLVVECPGLDGLRTVCPAVSLAAAAAGKRPQVPAKKAAAHQSESRTRADTVLPEDLCRREYRLGRIDVMCCEKLQLLDTETRGLGQVVWDAGVVLASYLAEAYSGLGSSPALLRKRQVVELGAGPGLPGVVSAICGAKVLLTDLQPTLSEICVPNAAANQRAVKASGSGGGLNVAELVWGEDVGQDIGGPVDVVLGADVVFDEEHFPLLLRTLQQLLPPCPRDSNTPCCGDGKALSSAGSKASKKGTKPKEPTGPFVPFALFSYRERKRCARHGCDTLAFFELLETAGYSVSDVELPPGSQSALYAQVTAEVAPKTIQPIRLKRVIGCSDRR
eukprot:m.263882 g.263882  ORF g.263882 m.263882 type:complete len:426 (-) comp16016_c1_seq3:837-2114(-)